MTYCSSAPMILFPSWYIYLNISLFFYFLFFFCSWQSVSVLAKQRQFQTLGFSREGRTVRRNTPRGFPLQPKPTFRLQLSEVQHENCISFKYNSKPNNVLYFNVLFFKVESQHPSQKYCKASLQQHFIIYQGDSLCTRLLLYNTKGECCIRSQVPTGLHGQRVIWMQML